MALQLAREALDEGAARDLLDRLSAGAHRERVGV
jgi:hypothetical protein